MTTTPSLHNGVTIVTNDQPYQRVAFQADRLTDCLRAAADWLDSAEKALGEVIFVSATEQNLDDGWQYEIYIYVDEFEKLPKPSLGTA